MVFSLNGSMPGWDRQTKDVSERPGIAVSDDSGEARDLRGQHLLGRDHRTQARQSSTMLGFGNTLNDVAVDQLTGEPDAHAHPRPGQQTLLLGNGVVEESVKMWQRDVDRNAGDR